MNIKVTSTKVRSVSIDSTEEALGSPFLISEFLKAYNSLTMEEGNPPLSIDEIKEKVKDDEEVFISFCGFCMAVLQFNIGGW